MIFLIYHIWKGEKQVINKMFRKKKCKSVIDRAEKVGIIVMALLLMPTAVQCIKKMISEGKSKAVSELQKLMAEENEKI